MNCLLRGRGRGGIDKMPPVLVFCEALKKVALNLMPHVRPLKKCNSLNAHYEASERWVL